MKTCFLSCFLFLNIFMTAAPSLPRYWLIEEDFIKMGKKELYEEEKKKELQQGSFEIVGIEDLENPQYVFLMPLEGIASLSLYPPLVNKKNPLLSSCLHFKIFSLHELLEKCSFRAESTLLDSSPYFSYVLYTISSGSEAVFEEHLTSLCAKQTKASCLSWRVWKVLIGTDVPKYLVCLSFPTKEELKEAKMEEVFEEIVMRDIIKDRKAGWMKKQKNLCRVK